MVEKERVSPQKYRLACQNGGAFKLPLVMPRTPEQFVRARQEAWTRLEGLVDKAQRERLEALSASELEELGLLYRRTSADLARAQTRYNTTQAGRDLVHSLNALVLRAHALVYSQPVGAAASGWEFFLFGFPAAFRRQWRLILFAALWMFVPALFAYFAVWSDPAQAPTLISADAIERVEERAQKQLVTGWGANTSYKGLVESPEIGAMIMTNNIRVSILAVALGITAGLGTAFVLASNGMMIGALAAVATNARVDFLFWSVILPHGVLELFAIAVAGGAGLLLARAIYAPGDLPRRDALRVAGTDAAQLLLGVAVLLVFAGIIEAFITPTTLPPTFKLTFAALTGVLLVVYLSLRAPSEKETIRKAKRAA